MAIGRQPVTHHLYRPGALVSHPDYNAGVWTARGLLDTNSQRGRGQGWVTNLHPEKDRRPPVRSEARAWQAEPQVSLNIPRGPLRPPLGPLPSLPHLKLSAPHTTSSPLLGLPDLLCVSFNLILLGEKVASRRPGTGGKVASVKKEGRLQREQTQKKFLKHGNKCYSKRKEKRKTHPQSLKNTAH